MYGMENVKRNNLENHDSRPLFLIGGAGCPTFTVVTQLSMEQQ
jgi:hypothetical protein